MFVYFWDSIWFHEVIIIIISLPRSFREYGEAVLRHLENIVASDSKLLKAPVNYEGVRSMISGTFFSSFGTLIRRVSCSILVLGWGWRSTTKQATDLAVWPCLGQRHISIHPHLSSKH